MDVSRSCERNIYPLARLTEGTEAMAAVSTFKLCVRRQACTSLLVAGWLKLAKEGMVRGRERVAKGEKMCFYRFPLEQWSEKSRDAILLSKMKREEYTRPMPQELERVTVLIH